MCAVLNSMGFPQDSLPQFPESSTKQAFSKLIIPFADVTLSLRDQLPCYC